MRSSALKPFSQSPVTRWPTSYFSTVISFSEMGLGGIAVTLEGVNVISNIGFGDSG